MKPKKSPKPKQPPSVENTAKRVLTEFPEARNVVVREVLTGKEFQLSRIDLSSVMSPCHL